MNRQSPRDSRHSDHQTPDRPARKGPWDWDGYSTLQKARAATRRRMQRYRERQKQKLREQQKQGLQENTLQEPLPDFS